MTSPDDRRCVLPHRRDPDRPRPATHGHLCNGCFDDLDRALRQLGALYVDLEQVLAVGGGGMAPRTSGSGEWDPLPVRPKVVDVRHDIVGVLVSWVLLVAEERNLENRPATNAPEACATWLHSHADWISCQPWCDDLAGEILTLYRRAQSLVSANRATTYRGPCSHHGCKGTVRITTRPRDDLWQSIAVCDGADKHEFKPGQYTALAAHWRKARERAMRETA